MILVEVCAPCLRHGLPDDTPQSQHSAADPGSFAPGNATPDQPSTAPQDAVVFQSALCKYSADASEYHGAEGPSPGSCLAMQGGWQQRPADVNKTSPDPIHAWEPTRGQPHHHLEALCKGWHASILQYLNQKALPSWSVLLPPPCLPSSSSPQIRLSNLHTGAIHAPQQLAAQALAMCARRLQGCSP